jgi:DNA-binding XRE family transcriptional regulator
MNLKELREKNKLTQAAFGSSLGVSGKAIYLIESGNMNLSRKLSDKIAEVYGEFIEPTGRRAKAAAARAEKKADAIATDAAQAVLDAEKKVDKRKRKAKAKVQADKPAVEAVAEAVAAPVEAVAEAVAVPVEAVAAAVAAPVVNTGIFLIGCLVFFMPTITEWATAAGVESAGKFMIVGLVGLNFIFELAINLVLSSVIVKLIKLGKKETE